MANPEARTLFSIITVTYNASATIAQTMESVATQTCKLYEHIIVDGASTDGTLEIVEKYKNKRTKIFSKPDAGIYDAMNRGMQMAKGEYYIFLNSGDRFHSKTTLQSIADAIFDNDFPGIVYGQTEIVDIDGNFLAPRHLNAPKELSLSSFKEGMTVCHQAFVAYYKIVSPFDLKYKFSADYEWCIRCLQHSRRNIYIDETLIDYLCEGVTTRNHRKSLKERFEIMSKYYGFFPTLGRHLLFVPRYFKRRKIEKHFIKN